jgi:hypothetical protein
MKRNWKVTLTKNMFGHRFNRVYGPSFKFPNFVDALHKFQQQVTACAIESLSQEPLHDIFIYKVYSPE